MASKKLCFWTYEEMARDIFKCPVQTIRNWVSKGVFRPYGYLKKGKFKVIAIVDETTVKKVMAQKIIFWHLFDRRGKYQRDNK